jgi:tetrahydromethanopterin S-methyltransferase subunit D
VAGWQWLGGSGVGCVWLASGACGSGWVAVGRVVRSKGFRMVVILGVNWSCIGRVMVAVAEMWQWLVWRCGSGWVAVSGTVGCAENRALEWW